jgi:hypothetical protein
VQILVHGSDANQARIVQATRKGGRAVDRSAACQGKHMVAGPANVQARAWFNERTRPILPGPADRAIMTLSGPSSRRL